jgi:hypothetical protein
LGQPKLMKTNSRSAATLPEAPLSLPLVIPTGAYPDFLLALLTTTTYAVFLKKTAYVDQRHGSQQEIRGERSGGTCGLPIPTPHLRAKTALPFVISTEAQRGGEICGLLIPTPLLRATTALPFVISTEAQRSEGTCGLPIPHLCYGLQQLSPLSSRPKRSAVERSAVQRSLLGNVLDEKCLVTVMTTPFKPVYSRLRTGLYSYRRNSFAA